jgi:hypothetical protein
MTKQQRVEYLLKQRETRQRKQVAADSFKNAQEYPALEPPGITNVFTVQM